MLSIYERIKNIDGIGQNTAAVEIVRDKISRRRRHRVLFYHLSRRIVQPAGDTACGHPPEPHYYLPADKGIGRYYQALWRIVVGDKDRIAVQDVAIRMQHFDTIIIHLHVFRVGVCISTCRG